MKRHDVTKGACRTSESMGFCQRGAHSRASHEYMISFPGQSIQNKQCSYNIYAYLSAERNKRFKIRANDGSECGIYDGNLRTSLGKDKFRLMPESAIWMIQDVPAIQLPEIRHHYVDLN